MVLALVVLLAFGCGDDKPEPVNLDANNDPVTNVSPKCQVTEWKGHDHPSVYTVTYEYDNQKKLVKAKRFTNGSLRTEVFYEYNSAWQIAKVENRDGNFVIEYL